MPCAALVWSAQRRSGCRGSAPDVLPAARHHYQAGTDKLTRRLKVLDLIAGPSSPRLLEVKAAFRSRTPPDVSRHPAVRRRAVLLQ